MVSVVPCARNSGICGDSVPGVLRMASDRHGSTVAMLGTERKACSSGFSVCRRSRMSRTTSSSSLPSSNNFGYDSIAHAEVSA